MEPIWQTMDTWFYDWPGWLSFLVRVVLYPFIYTTVQVGKFLGVYRDNAFAFPTPVGILYRLFLFTLVLGPAWYINRYHGNPIVLAASLGKVMAAREADFRVQEESLRHQLTELGSPALKVDVPGASVEGVRTLVEERLALVNTLRDNYEQIATSVQGLQVSYRTAPTVFRRAGAAYREWADAATYEAIKDDYAMAATAWEDLALHAERQSQWLDQAESDLRMAVEGAAEVQLVLSRLKAFVDQYPSDLRGEGDRAALFQRVQVSMAKYRDLYSELQALHQKVQERRLDIERYPTANASK